MLDLPYSAAADRNWEPILGQLHRVLAPQGTALEIAAGTGQHAASFAAALKEWLWQPTDSDVSMLPVIAARAMQTGLDNIRPPLQLDVMAAEWPSQDAPFSERFDAIYCANMLHIAPWEACAGLMRGTARHLSTAGVLITYGPYFEEAVPPAPSNIAFDESLRARNRAWGIRRLEDVADEARRVGLVLRERHTMPANNLLLVFGF